MLAVALTLLHGWGVQVISKPQVNLKGKSVSIGRRLVVMSRVGEEGRT